MLIVRCEAAPARWCAAERRVRCKEAAEVRSPGSARRRLTRRRRAQRLCVDDGRRAPRARSGRQQAFRARALAGCGGARYLGAKMRAAGVRGVPGSRAHPITYLGRYRSQQRARTSRSYDTRAAALVWAGRVTASRRAGHTVVRLGGTHTRFDVSRTHPSTRVYATLLRTAYTA